MFTLEPRHWYAWTMYAGYGDEPYRSPIRVDQITPKGGRRFELSFWNCGYAEGVQDMTKELRTLKRQGCLILAEEVEHAQRVVLIEPLTTRWVGAYAPAFGDWLLRGLVDLPLTTAK